MQTYQILTNNYEVCIPSLSSILIAVQFSLKLRAKKFSLKIILCLVKMSTKKKVKIYCLWMFLWIQIHVQRLGTLSN